MHGLMFACSLVTMSTDGIGLYLKKDKTAGQDSLWQSIGAGARATEARRPATRSSPRRNSAAYMSCVRSGNGARASTAAVR